VAQAATLTQAQLDRVLRFVAKKRHARRNRAMLLLTHYAGMRVGEVAALLYGDVVDRQGGIKAEVVLSKTQTKGHRSRVVWLSEKAQEELAAYVSQHKARCQEQPLFSTQRSAGFTANSLTHLLNSLYAQAGIENASSHTGRRTFITNLAEKGVGVRVLMKLAGHANMATTQRYIDVRPAMMRNAVELI
jgi:integrase/recombinase XerD